jgi:hypothetical protein
LRADDATPIGQARQEVELLAIPLDEVIPCHQLAAARPSRSVLRTPDGRRAATQVRRRP